MRTTKCNEIEIIPGVMLRSICGIPYTAIIPGSRGSRTKILTIVGPMAEFRVLDLTRRVHVDLKP